MMVGHLYDTTSQQVIQHIVEFHKKLDEFAMPEIHNGRYLSPHFQIREDPCVLENIPMNIILMTHSCGFWPFWGRGLPEVHPTHMHPWRVGGNSFDVHVEVRANPIQMKCNEP